MSAAVRGHAAGAPPTDDEWLVSLAFPFVPDGSCLKSGRGNHAVSHDLADKQSLAHRPSPPHTLEGVREATENRGTPATCLSRVAVSSFLLMVRVYVGHDGVSYRVHDAVYGVPPTKPFKNVRLPPPELRTGHCVDDPLQSK
jgi:hypothetical protein